MRKSWSALLCGLSLIQAGCTGQLLGDGDGDGVNGGNDGGGKPPTSGGVIELPGGLNIKGSPRYYRVVRLTHTQWENSVRDVLQLPAHTGLSSTFISDPPDGKFSNNERALYVNDTLSGDYQRSAENVAQTVAEDATQLARLSAPGDSAGFIASVGRRAFRRALSAEEQSAYEALWAEGASFFGSGDAFADGARVFIEALLQSPNFVYRVEVSNGGERLSGLELATKLSFLLRNTTPSEELLAAAEAGALDTEQGFASLVGTMIEEDGARVAVETFHRELFGLDRYSSIAKSLTLYPEFNEDMNELLFAADLMFFNHIFTQNHGYREILTTDVAFVNETLAPYYGLAVSGADLQAAQLDGTRPGYLTRVGFLAYNGNLTQPDPIHRGVNINNKLLCAQLSPPPGEIPALPDSVPGQTNRERVTAHTGEGFCGNCHNEIINPPGFALEAFDTVGKYRTTDNGKPVDTTGKFLIGQKLVEFTNINQLTDAIAESDLGHSCYTAQLTEYAFGRDLGSGESDIVSSTQAQSLNSDASIKAMLRTLITSPEFARAPTTESL